MEGPKVRLVVPPYLRTHTKKVQLIMKSATGPSHRPPINDHGSPQPLNEPSCHVQAFRFSDLPGEIRNMIYEYPLVDFENCFRLCLALGGPGRFWKPRSESPDRDDLPGQVRGSANRFAWGSEKTRCVPRSHSCKSASRSMRKRARSSMGRISSASSH